MFFHVILFETCLRGLLGHALGLHLLHGGRGRHRSGRGRGGLLGLRNHGCRGRGALAAGRRLSHGPLVGGLGIGLAHLIPYLAHLLMPRLQLLGGVALGGRAAIRVLARTATAAVLQLVTGRALQVLQRLLNLVDALHQGDVVGLSRSSLNNGGHFGF